MSLLSHADSTHKCWHCRQCRRFMTCGFFPSRRPLAFKDSPCLPSLYPSFYGDTRWVSTRNDPLNAGTFHSVEAMAAPAAAALFMGAIQACIISLLPFWSRLQFSYLTCVALLRASAECKALSLSPLFPLDGLLSNPPQRYSIHHSSTFPSSSRVSKRLPLPGCSILS